jgi:hypothetical protein
LGRCGTGRNVKDRGLRAALLPKRLCLLPKKLGLGVHVLRGSARLRHSGGALLVAEHGTVDIEIRDAVEYDR